MTVNDWPARATAASMRQWPTLRALADRVGEAGSIEGLILLGSFASGTPDELSDIDVVVVAAAGRFEEAWGARHGLWKDALVSWDLRAQQDCRGHRWLTRDVVKVDCTVVDPESGSKDLADPFVVIVGAESIADRFPRVSTETVRERARKIDEDQRQQAWDPDEMDYGEVIDWKLAELKRAVRRGLRGKPMPPAIK